MPRLVAIDSGPLVSLFDRDDEHHNQAVRFFSRFTARGVLTVAQITEVMYLLDYDVRVQIDFLRWVSRGSVEVEVVTQADLVRVIELLEKYADMSMDFADASLIALCERRETRQVASLDKEFAIYRYRNRLPFENLFFA